MLYVISLTERALARAEEVRNPAFPKRQNRGTRRAQFSRIPEQTRNRQFGLKERLPLSLALAETNACAKRRKSHPRLARNRKAQGVDAAKLPLLRMSPAYPTGGPCSARSSKALSSRGPTLMAQSVARGSTVAPCTAEFKSPVISARTERA